MSLSLQKSRFLHLHPQVNTGKSTRLEALHNEYVAYVRICVLHMLTKRRPNLPKSEKQDFSQRCGPMMMRTWLESPHGRNLHLLNDFPLIERILGTHMASLARDFGLDAEPPQ